MPGLALKRLELLKRGKINYLFIFLSLAMYLFGIEKLQIRSSEVGDILTFIPLTKNNS